MMELARRAVEALEQIAVELAKLNAFIHLATAERNGVISQEQFTEQLRRNIFDAWGRM